MNDQRRPDFAPTDDLGVVASVLREPFEGMRVLEVKADRSTLRALHASIRAAIKAAP